MTFNKPIDKKDTPIILNDNGHKIFTWSFNLKERVLQFWNQLVRTNKIQLQVLKSIFNGILMEASSKLNSLSSIEQTEGRDVLVLMYKMIAQTRDIKNGKGEYFLSYMMICVWYEYFPDAAIYAIESFVKTSSTERPYGSWKDIKYFCNYCKNEEKLKDLHPLIVAPLMMMNKQLKKDNENLGKENISYAAKWAPREKSNKFGWQFEIMAQCYYSDYFGCSTSSEYKNALNKAKMDLRKIVSKLNRHLQTPQVTMCNDLWDNIIVDNLTSRTIFKNQNAFLNIKNNGERRFFSTDRGSFAKQFGEYIESSSTKENICKKMKGNDIEIYEFVKKAYEILEHKEKGFIDENTYKTKVKLLELQWSDFSKKINKLRDCLVFIDFSLSMDPLSLYSSIGLACLILEKSTFGKGLIIFSGDYKWINLENKYEKGFVEIISEIKRESEIDFQRTYSNIYKAFNSVVDVIIKNKLSDTHFCDMNFVILSNMKFERDKFDSPDILSKNICNIFNKAGLASIGKEYIQPYFVLWNVESSNEFMVEGITDKFMVFSGYKNFVLKSLAINEGFKDNKAMIQLITPWETFLKILNSKRYNKMEFFIRHLINYNQK